LRSNPKPGGTGKILRMSCAAPRSGRYGQDTQNELRSTPKPGNADFRPAIFQQGVLSTIVLTKVEDFLRKQKRREQPQIAANVR